MINGVAQTEVVNNGAYLYFSFSDYKILLFFLLFLYRLLTRIKDVMQALLIPVKAYFLLIYW